LWWRTAAAPAPATAAAPATTGEGLLAAGEQLANAADGSAGLAGASLQAVLDSGGLLLGLDAAELLDVGVGHDATEVVGLGELLLGLFVGGHLDLLLFRPLGDLGGLLGLLTLAGQELLGQGLDLLVGRGRHVELLFLGEALRHLGGGHLLGVGLLVGPVQGGELRIHRHDLVLLGGATVGRPSSRSSL
jgi:hypothetical protein